MMRLDRTSSFNILDIGWDEMEMRGDETDCAVLSCDRAVIVMCCVEGKKVKHEKSILNVEDTLYSKWKVLSDIVQLAHKASPSTSMHSAFRAAKSDVHCSKRSGEPCFCCRGKS